MGAKIGILQKLRDEMEDTTILELNGPHMGVYMVAPEGKKTEEFPCGGV